MKSGIDAKEIEEGDFSKLFEICFDKHAENHFTSETLKRPANSRQELKNSKADVVALTKMALAR